MRSPITRTPSVSTAAVALHTPLRILSLRAAGRVQESASAAARMKSGVVPQQPPRIVTPFSGALDSSAANSAGVI